MDRKNISSGSPYEGPIGFSRAVRIGNVVAVSGTAPIAPDGSVAAPGDPYGQARRCLEIIESVLKQAGASMENVIRTRIFLTDAKQWAEIGRAHGEFFGNIRPATTFAEVRLLNPQWLCEIEADAVLPE